MDFRFARVTERNTREKTLDHRRETDAFRRKEDWHFKQYKQQTLGKLAGEIRNRPLVDRHRHDA